MALAVDLLIIVVHINDKTHDIHIRYGVDGIVTAVQICNKESQLIDVVAVFRSANIAFAHAKNVDDGLVTVFLSRLIGCPCLQIELIVMMTFEVARQYLNFADAVHKVALNVFVFNILECHDESSYLSNSRFPC